MESLLQGIPSTVVYFDDILVTGDTAAESFHNLDQILERLKKEKCTFGAEEVVFLGHRINSSGSNRWMRKWRLWLKQNRQKTSSS